MTTVLKLGGSVITVKDTPETVDEPALDRAAAALSESPDQLVVVHGGGSFGHHHAAAHNVSTTAGTHDDVAVRDIHGAMKRLNAEVINALSDEVPVVPVHPFSAAHRQADGSLQFPGETIETILKEGFVPVLHGDVVIHATEGATILSGDELVVTLAAALSADRIGVCSAVSGVYDADGNVIDHIESFDDVAAAVGESQDTDVTGGMAGKVRTLLSLNAPASVFGIEGLEAFIAGENPGTRIR